MEADNFLGRTRRAPGAAPPPWPLLRRLPAKVGTLPAELARHLGTAVDAGRVRLVLDDSGDAVATRGSRA